MFDAFQTKILHHGVSRAEADQLAALCHGPVPVKARTDIFDGDAPRDALAILLEGWACKVQVLANGRRQIVQIHLPGEVCNLGSLARAGTASSIAALSDCKIATLPLVPLRAMIGERPAIRDLFLALTIAENAAMTERVVSLGARSSRQRVAHFLLDLLGRLEPLGAAPAKTLRPPLTQQDIGDMLGLSTVHVSRTFQFLRQSGFVAIRGRTYTINDPAGLQALADDGTRPERRSPARAAGRTAGSESPAA